MNQMQSSTERTSRLFALDEARAFAIVAMIIAHWGPAVVESANISEEAHSAVRIVSRFATPGFVVIFSLTVGLVYLHRYRTSAAEGRKKIRSKILKRSRLVLFMGFAVSLPEYINIILSDNPSVKSFVLATYGILSAYAIVIASLPLALLLTGARSLPMLVGGVALWAIGGVVAFYLWPADPLVGWPELIRLFLFSGAYAAVPMLGTMLLVAPVGAMLHTVTRKGFRAILTCIGFASLSSGMLVGVLMGYWAEISTGDPSPKDPPRIWFVAMYGGLALLIVAVLDMMPSWKALTVGRTPFRLLGTSALQVYVAHVFVIPGSKFLSPFLGETVAEVAMLGLFFFYVSVIFIIKLQVFPKKPMAVTSGDVGTERQLSE